MAATYQIAVIGDWESVMGFRALGLDTYPVTSAEEAKEKVRELADDFHCPIVGTLSRSDTVQEAEELGKTVVEAFPKSSMAGEYRALAEKILEVCGVKPC